MDSPEAQQMALDAQQIKKGDELVRISKQLDESLAHGQDPSRLEDKLKRKLISLMEAGEDAVLHYGLDNAYAASVFLGEGLEAVLEASAEEIVVNGVDGPVLQELYLLPFIFTATGREVLYSETHTVSKEACLALADAFRNHGWAGSAVDVYISPHMYHPDELGNAQWSQVHQLNKRLAAWIDNGASEDMSPRFGEGLPATAAAYYAAGLANETIVLRFMAIVTRAPLGQVASYEGMSFGASLELASEPQAGETMQAAEDRAATMIKALYAPVANILTMKLGRGMDTKALSLVAPDFYYSAFYGGLTEYNSLATLARVSQVINQRFMLPAEVTVVMAPVQLEGSDTLGEIRISVIEQATEKLIAGVERTLLYYEDPQTIIASLQDGFHEMGVRKVGVHGAPLPASSCPGCGEPLYLLPDGSLGHLTDEEEDAGEASSSIPRILH